jgi:hypothetical protein
MWDYYAFPVWSGGSLPRELEAALQSWSDEGTEAYAAALEADGEPASAWTLDWSRRGRALALQVAAHLGPVDFWNESTREIERITVTPPRPPAETA